MISLTFGRLFAVSGFRPSAGPAIKRYRNRKNVQMPRRGCFFFRTGGRSGFLTVMFCAASLDVAVARQTYWAAREPAVGDNMRLAFVRNT